MTIGLCRHCQERPANRSRGLCYRCFSDPAIRALYPPAANKFCRQGVGIASYGHGAAEPTGAIPGSEEKIGVLEERAALGLRLFHAGDATYEDMPAPVFPESEEDDFDE